MGRLLGPNETKFWLLDRAAPMNAVAVLPLAQPDPDALTRAVAALALPVTVVGDHDRPRWTAPQATAVLEHRATGDPFGWIGEVERLLTQRTGSEGAPCCRAVLLKHGTDHALLLGAGHTLCDWRALIGLAEAIVADVPVPLPMPASEELLPGTAYAAPDADDLLDFWWSPAAARNWQAAGLDRLTGMFAPAVDPSLHYHTLEPPLTEALLARCEHEKVSLANVLSVAARDVCGIADLAVSVDMTRFMNAPPPYQPGLAVSHLNIALPSGPLWQGARQLRADLRGQIAAGVAGDNLLALPRALKQGSAETVSRAPEAAITSAPGRPRSRGWVISSARGGGFVLTPVKNTEGGLTLIAALRPGDDTAIPARLAGVLAKAAGA